MTLVPSHRETRTKRAHLRASARIAWLTLPLALTACQIISPEPPPPARLSVDRVGAAPAPKPAMVDVTFRVQRGTVRDALSIPGKVVPARFIQLSFPNNGTITAVNVRSGETVRRGQALADMVLTDDALRETRAEAQLADLAYEAQLSKLEELKAGARPSTVEHARAEVARMRALVRSLELTRADPTNAVRAAEGNVAIAQLGVEQARDTLAVAQAVLRRGQEAAQSESAAAASASALARATASANVRAAERRLTEATIRLEQARADASSRPVSDVDVQFAQLALDQARDDLAEAQAAARRGVDSSVGEITAAQLRAAQAAAVRTAERRVTEAAARLDQVRAAASAGSSRAADVQLAQLVVDQAKDELARAQLNEERAARGEAITTQAIAADAAAGVRASERQVTEAIIKLEQAQAALSVAQGEREARGEILQLELASRRAELAAAEARLNEVRAGPAADQVAREEKRLALLREQADATRRAAQPEATLIAPFDGVVMAVTMSVGQQVAARSGVIRIAADSNLSVIATASEYEVPHLAADQPIEVTFPGLAEGATTGRIVDVSGVATTDESGKTAYPVRIDLPTTPAGLKVGMTATVNVNLREATGVLFVPAAAIRAIDGRSVVTRVDAQGRISDVAVQVGPTYGTNVEVLGGIDEGDLVAVYSPSTSARRP